MKRRSLALILALLASCTGETREPATRATPEPATRASPSRPDGVGGAPAPCWASERAAGTEAISFSDVTENLGLVDPLVGMFGHAAAWGDVNADGWPDVFVGTFSNRPVEAYQERGATGPSPDRLLLGGPDGFRSANGFPEMYGRTSGALFADLDADGDLDLVASRNVTPDSDRPTEILENVDGSFRVVENGGVPAELGGRSVGVLDANGDGVPDLFIAEDRWSGGSSVLLRGEGELRFTDATQEAGLPTDIHGLGVGISDLTGDGRSDLFVAGSNRLFVANGDGTFREAVRSVFRWETYGEEDDVSGVAIADLNRDGWPDIVLGHHYNSTVDFGRRVPVRLYLHRGLDGNENPVFEDVTEASGLSALPTKAPHVEIVDFDNDGWPDVLTTASTAGNRPAIFRHWGLDGGIPRFASTGQPGPAQYWVTGPAEDFDRDGRVDILLVEWEPARPSLLLRNETASGGWLSVSVDTELSGGLGARVSVFEAGRIGEPDALIGSREIVASQGYAAGGPARVHFGLGRLSRADVRIELPGMEPIEATHVPADRHIRLPSECE